MTHTKVCKLAKVKIGVLCGNYLDCGKSSYNSWRPEAVSDEWEMRQVSLDSSFQDLLWPCVAERGAVLVQQVHQFFSDHPVIQNYPVSYNTKKHSGRAKRDPTILKILYHTTIGLSNSSKNKSRNFWFFWIFGLIWVPYSCVIMVKRSETWFFMKDIPFWDFRGGSKLEKCSFNVHPSKVLSITSWCCMLAMPYH